MILGKYDGPTSRNRSLAARVSVRAAVAALAGLMVTGAAATTPALAGPHPASSRTNPAPRWTQVTTGGLSTCATRADGTLWCWGANLNGNLGIGNYSNQDLPQQVTAPGAHGWAIVSADYFHTCATRTDGTLWCWGGNYYGELGLGTSATESPDLPQQVTTPAPGGWASVAAGYYHTCATRTDGTLWCWGNNGFGELGIGTRTSQDRPRQVTTPATGGWASVAASGYDHTCATRTDGSLWCWGDGTSGQVGIGSDNSQDRPRQLFFPGTVGWTSITAGYYDSCATRAGGGLWCWGTNGSGELGIGNQTGQDRPQRVSTTTPERWASVAAGNQHTCGTGTDGTLWCWGDNNLGDLGIGNETGQDQPAQVTSPAPGGWASTATGMQQSCAIRTDGSLWCWGGNDFGELGIGNTNVELQPQQVTS